MFTLKGRIASAELRSRVTFSTVSSNDSKEKIPLQLKHAFRRPRSAFQWTACPPKCAEARNLTPKRGGGGRGEEVGNDLQGAKVVQLKWYRLV